MNLNKEENNDILASLLKVFSYYWIFAFTSKIIDAHGHLKLTLCAQYVQLFETPWTIAYQASLSMEFPRQVYWGGLLLPPPGDLPNPGIKSASPALAGGFFTTELPGKSFTAGQIRAKTHPPTLQGSHSGKSCLQGPGALERNVSLLGPGGKQGCNKKQIKIPRLGFTLLCTLMPVSSGICPRES